MKRLIYYCPKCDVDKPLIRITRRADEDELCETCGARGYYAYIKSVGQTSGDKNYSHPIHSDSLAISPAQVAEHKKMFPNIKIDSDCRPVFDNYVEHDKYLQKCGFVKGKQKIRAHNRKENKVSTKQPSK